MTSDETYWLFGYGSNMRVEHIEEQKRVQVLEHTVCILKGYRLVFNLPGVPKAEPVFANSLKTGNAKDEIHGVAFRITKEHLDEMDHYELGYDREPVKLQAYNGRSISGFVFVSKPSMSLLDHDGTPSRRYLGLLVQGAQEAGLKESYINDLKKRTTYEPSRETLQTRENFLSCPLASFKIIHLKDLPPHATSICGYVFSCHPTNFVHMLLNVGKEISLMRVFHFYGLEFRGPKAVNPPYPSLDVLKLRHENAYDYLLTWLDFYLNSSCSISCIGRLAEYVTSDDFVLPEGCHDSTKVLC